jgi:acetyl esterase/lipase
MGEKTHAGSKLNLLGANPDPKLVELLSNEKQVRDDTPPCFIWHRDEDTSVVVDNSLLFAMALRAHHVPFDLHVYEKGGHGSGLGKSSLDPSRLHPWTDDLIYWFHDRGLLKQ